MQQTLLLRRIFLATCAAWTAAAVPDAVAQDYPSRPIRYIVPFAPSGGTDIVARAVAPRLSAALGQQIIVDNRPGAGTVLGTEIAAKSLPDGYTIMQGSTSLSINPSLRVKLPYETLRDLAPITQTASQAYLVVTHPSLSAKSIKELIVLAKAKPGQLNFGSPGTGSGGHLAGELFKLMTGVDMVHIPYKGGGPALTDLLGGQINLIFSTILAALPHVKSGRLQAIAVSTARRSSVLPDVPTVAESGVPGYESSSWNGVLAPAGTARDIIARLNREIVRILHAPEMREWFANDGAEPVGGTPAEFTALIKSDTIKWAKVIKAAGIKPE